MSEASPDRFLQHLSPLSARNLMTFNAERHELYEWMGEQALQMPDYPEIQSETMERVDTVSNAFGQSVWAIQRSITNKNTASFFICRSWIYDTQQRTQMIQEIMPQAGVQQLEPSYIRSIVDLALWSQKPNHSAVVTLQGKYYETIKDDVVDFFSWMRVSKGIMHKYGRRDLELEKLVKGQLYEVSGPYLEWASNQFGKTALKGLL